MDMGISRIDRRPIAITAAIAAVILLGLSHCTIEKPEAPTWDTQLVVPLVNRTYAMPELLDRLDQDGLSISNDSIIYSLTYDIDTVRPASDNFSTPDISVGVGRRLGPVRLSSPSLSPVSANITSIAALALLVPGDVPPVSFGIRQTLPPVNSFSSIFIDTGYVYLVITNQLGIPLDNIIVTLRDERRNQVVGAGIIAGPLGSGSRDSVYIDLAGRSLSDSVSVTTDAHTAGGTISDVVGKELMAQARFSPWLVTSSATAQIPQITRATSASVMINESYRVTSALITAGTLSLVITNLTNLSGDITVTVPQLTISGSPLSITRTVPGRSAVNAPVALSGYRLSPNGTTVPQTLGFSASLNSPGSSGQQVAVAASDSFSVGAQLSGLTFGEISGVFTPQIISISPIQEQIEVPQGFEAFHMANAVAIVTVINGVQVAGDLDLQVDASNGKQLAFGGPINPSGSLATATSVITSPNAADLLNPFPNQVTISGSATIGDGITVGTIRAGDFVTGQVRFTAPFEVIVDSTPVYTDVDSEDISQKDIDAITDHVQQARLVYAVTNRLPVGARIELFFGPDSATVYTAPQLRVDSIMVTAAPVSGGIAVDTASTGLRSVKLDNTDIQVLRNATLYMGQRITFEDTNGQAVRFTTTDYITITARAEVVYRFDGEF